ncbi:DNA polymerase III subunit beta [Suttonella sp. R2A3]|uniref:DNA polymerase III subunit beta n=1 Tax=Suttonella sp. R2A3 TaxID=2908648 RepID=UPI001F287FBA|nr:DNA polymerase III subunit beta [Suttonella sp. R2A3]UJF23930.1 DNA polymerase III subunit beta [Suttonella sp. R2A3]
MKFRIVKETLLDALNDINGIVERKSPSVIITHVLIEAKDGALYLTGTDTEVTLKANIAAEIREEGSITVPAGKFADVVKSMPNGVFIDCQLNEAQFVIRAGNSQLNLVTLPSMDFPVLEVSDSDYSIQINSMTLHEAMQKVRFSMATQDVRYYLNGLYLHTLGESNRIHAVSTNGHRLSCAGAQTENSEQSEHGIILPKKAVNELAKLTGRFDQSLSLGISQRQLTLHLANYTFTTNLVEGNYPDYENAIPDKQEQPIIIAREVFIEALQRAKVLLVDRHDGIRLTFDEHVLRLAARNQDNETSNETLDVINNRFELLETTFNINYLIEALSHIEGENILMHISSGESACLITSEEDPQVRYVIMPMGN